MATREYIAKSIDNRTIRVTLFETLCASIDIECGVHGDEVSTDVNELEELLDEIKQSEIEFRAK